MALETKLQVGGQPSLSASAKMLSASAKMTLPGLVLQLLSDRELLKNAILVIFGLLFMALLAVFATLLSVRYFYPPITVKVQESGAIVITTQQNHRAAAFNLSPNGGEQSPWINTGIYIEKGQTVSIKASGRVCTAMHRMMEAALKNHQLPPVPYNGPEGIPDSSTSYPPYTSREEEKIRAPWRVDPKSRQGKLIGMINPVTPPHRLVDREALKIGESFSETAQTSGMLWLTVNDIWLDRSDESKNAYLAGAVNIKEREDAWKDPAYHGFWGGCQASRPGSAMLRATDHLLVHPRQGGRHAGGRPHDRAYSGAQDHLHPLLPAGI